MTHIYSGMYYSCLYFAVILRTKIIVGQCYLGYNNAGSGYDVYDMENPLIEGTFNLTWVYTSSANAQVSGYVNIRTDLFFLYYYYYLPFH